MPRSFPIAVKLKLIVLIGAVTFGLAGFLGVTRDIAGVSASAFGPAASHTGAPDEANCTECHNSFARQQWNG